MSRSKGTSLGTIFVAGIAILMVVGAVMTLVRKPSREAPQKAAAQPADKYGKEHDAIRIAQKQLKTFLTNPLDAEFGWATSARLTDDVNGHRNWVVAGTVKAPNGFGAKLTKPYQVTINFSANTWSTLFVAIDGETIYIDQKAFADQLSKQPAGQGS